MKIIKFLFLLPIAIVIIQLLAGLYFGNLKSINELQTAFYGFTIIFYLLVLIEEIRESKQKSKLSDKTTKDILERVKLIEKIINAKKDEK
jgi:hypothetical protein